MSVWRGSNLKRACYANRRLHVNWWYEKKASYPIPATYKNAENLFRIVPLFHAYILNAAVIKIAGDNTAARNRTAMRYPFFLAIKPTNDKKRLTLSNARRFDAVTKK